MLLLGVLQAQAAGQVAGSFDLLETQVLASSAANVTFSSLSTYAADYQHLQIRAVARTSATVSWADTLLVRFNGDSANNYAHHLLFGTGSEILSGATTSTNGISQILITGSGNSSNSSIYGPAVIDILDFANSSKNTTIRAFSGITSIGNQVRLTSGFWNNTAALTSIELRSSNAGNFLTGSRFSLYGIRGG